MKEDSVKISVVVPIYNCEKYLEQCLNSILNQTFKDFEIICVDDGSTDISVKILKEFANKDSRMILLSQKNSGAGVARNRGLHYAKGEYLYFLDSDDFIEPSLLEKMYNKIVLEDSDICICKNDLYDEKLESFSTPNWVKKFSELENIKAFNCKDYKYNIYQLFNIPAYTKLYKTEFIKQINAKFQDLKICNDVFFYLYTIGLATKISTVNEVLVHYRINQTQNLSAKRGDKTACIIKAFKKAKKELKRKNIFNVIKKSFYKMAKSCFDYELSQIQDNYTKRLWTLKLYEFLPTKYWNSRIYGLWFSKLFSIKKSSTHILFSFLGIRISIRKDKPESIKELSSRISLLEKEVSDLKQQIRGE